MKDHFNVIFQHVLREGNTLADYLTNLAFSSAGTMTINPFNELSSAGRRLLDLDKAHVPNLMIRVAKRMPPL